MTFRGPMLIVRLHVAFYCTQSTFSLFSASGIGQCRLSYEYIALLSCKGPLRIKAQSQQFFISIRTQSQQLSIEIILA